MKTLQYQINRLEKSQNFFRRSNFLTLNYYGSMKTFKTLFIVFMCSSLFGAYVKDKNNVYYSDDFSSHDSLSDLTSIGWTIATPKAASSVELISLPGSSGKTLALIPGSTTYQSEYCSPQVNYYLSTDFNRKIALQFNLYLENTRLLLFYLYDSNNRLSLHLSIDNNIVKVYSENAWHTISTIPDGWTKCKFVLNPNKTITYYFDDMENPVSTKPFRDRNANNFRHLKILPYNINANEISAIDNLMLYNCKKERDYYSDDFENHSTKDNLEDAGWTFTGDEASISIGNNLGGNDTKFLKLTPTSLYDPTAKIYLPKVINDNSMFIEFDIYHNTTSPTTVFKLFGANGKISSHMLFSGGNIKVYKSAWETIGTYSTGWTHIRILANIHDKTIDVYIGDGSTIVAKSIGFRDSTAVDFKYLEIFPYSTVANEILAIDNIKFYKPKELHISLDLPDDMTLSKGLLPVSALIELIDYYAKLNINKINFLSARGTSLTSYYDWTEEGVHLLQTICDYAHNKKMKVSLCG